MIIDNLALKRSKVVVNSNELKSYLSNERKIDLENINTVYHFSPDENHKIKLEELNKLNKTIAYAGNFGTPQDILSFAQDFNKANDGSWQLLLIGSGSQYDQVKSMESHSIFVSPYVSKDKLNKLLEGVQIMLVALSSNLTVEGFPGKTFDYMARGKYILGYTNPYSAVARLITDYEIGTTIHPGEYRELKKFLDDVSIEDIRKGSNNSIQSSKSDFSKEVIVSQYLELLR